jgi:hypothetical protein
METRVGDSNRVVVLIRSDPRKSHRPGEGIRIALGLAAGEHRVEVILSGNAPFLLTPQIEELEDGETAEKFLTTLKEYVDTFYVEKATAVDLSDSDYPLTPVGPEEIAKKISDADCFLVF